MADFKYLEKNDFEKYAPVLFEILADNMTQIAPTGSTREEDFALWYAFAKESFCEKGRSVVLVFETGTQNVIGYFQYSVCGDTFLMEEIELKADFHGKGNIFRELYRFVLSELPESLAYVEAYADKRNQKSIGILAKLGLRVVGTNRSGNSFRFRGSYCDLLTWNNVK